VPRSAAGELDQIRRAYHAASGDRGFDKRINNPKAGQRAPIVAARCGDSERIRQALALLAPGTLLSCDLAAATSLHHDRALAEGLPIATGVIEGACRYLVQDRMGRTGARWSATGAETILRLRALGASGDFDDYWSFHLAKEYERTHQSRYSDNVVPTRCRHVDRGQGLSSDRSCSHRATA